MGTAARAEAPRLELADGKYPLWAIQPLDRRIYVVSLDGTWKRPIAQGGELSAGLAFPDGTTYSHCPIDDDFFALGEIRFMLPEYVLMRKGVAKSGKLKLTVTERPEAGTSAEAISNEVEIHWPIKRPIVPKAPATKYTPRPPIDMMPLEGTLPEKKK